MENSEELTLNPETKGMWQKPIDFILENATLLVPEHGVYTSVSPKYSLTSESDRILITFCLFSLGSLDQMGALLNANDKATVIGRAMQDAKLVQKYGCEFLIATLEKPYSEIKSTR